MRDDAHHSAGDAPVAHRSQWATAMRVAGFALGLVFAAGCAETGAHLTLSAPSGPTSAASFRVVLASADKVAEIRNQRVRISENTAQSVTYFMQRTIAGTADASIPAVDGFMVRIAPTGAVDDTQFIPFVLMYDDAGTLTGIATYRAGEGSAPSPILVVRDEIDKYKLTVEPVTVVGDTAEPAPGQVQLIECTRDDQSTFASGLVWRPLGGGELRIVLPSDGGEDATGRELDLDCDAHLVTAESSGPDCDDTRDWFHRDAEDTCDGYDTNCDNLSAIATTCTSNDICFDSTMNAHAGVELCDDRTGTSLGCNSSASCLCASGQTCFTCEVPWMPGTAQAVRPCQPAVGVMKTYGRCSETAPCTVEVVGAPEGWKVEIATTAASSFGIRAQGVGEQFAIKVKRPEGPGYEQPGDAGVGLGDIDLAIITANKATYLGVRLGLADGPSPGSCPAEPVLRCYP